MSALKERLGKFGLSLNGEKTKLLEFGRFAVSNRKERKQGKPDTFDFLGVYAYLFSAPLRRWVHAEKIDDSQKAESKNQRGKTGIVEQPAQGCLRTG